MEETTKEISTCARKPTKKSHCFLATTLDLLQLYPRSKCKPPYIWCSIQTLTTLSQSYYKLLYIWHFVHKLWKTRPSATPTLTPPLNESFHPRWLKDSTIPSYLYPTKPQVSLEIRNYIKLTLNTWRATSRHPTIIKYPKVDTQEKSWYLLAPIELEFLIQIKGRNLGPLQSLKFSKSDSLRISLDSSHKSYIETHHANY